MDLSGKHNEIINEKADKTPVIWSLICLAKYPTFIFINMYDIMLIKI